MQYTLEQVTAVARSTGLTGDALATAVAIAGWSGSPKAGESGGKTDAVGDQTLANGKWGPSIGLWQVRSLNVELGSGGARDRNQLSDPAFNARSMYKISSGGTNWQPWSVYTHGIFEANMSQARKAAGGDSSGVTLPTFTISNPLAAGVLPLPTGGISLWPSSEMWARIGWAAVGSLMVMYGVGMIVGASKGDELKMAAKAYVGSKTGGATNG